MLELDTLPILKDRKKRQYIEVAVVVLWSVFLLWFGLVDGISSAKSAKDYTAQAQATAVKLDSKLDAIKEAKTLMNEHSELALLIEDSVPSTPKAVTFVNSMALLVNNSNLVLTKLDYQGEASTENKGEAIPLRFSLGAKGYYADIEALIGRLERLPRIIKIDSIAMKKDTRVTENDNKDVQTQGSSDLDVSITGVFFYRNEQ